MLKSPALENCNRTLNKPVHSFISKPRLQCPIKYGLYVQNLNLFLLENKYRIQDQPISSPQNLHLGLNGPICFSLLLFLFCWCYCEGQVSWLFGTCFSLIKQLSNRMQWCHSKQPQLDILKPHQHQCVNISSAMPIQGSTKKPSSNRGLKMLDSKGVTIFKIPKTE